MATTSTNSRGVTRTSLGARERFKLTQLVMTKYAGSGMSDLEFAKKMEEELKLPITASHIMYIRKEFEIPANGGAPGVPKGRLVILEQRIEDLETKMTVLLRERAQHHGGK